MNEVQVVCQDSAWYDHIVLAHPEMVGFDRRLGQQFLRVIVEYNAASPPAPSGTIMLTAFAATGPKRGEILVWPNS